MRHNRKKKKAGSRIRYFSKLFISLIFAVFLFNILTIWALRWVQVPTSAFMIKQILSGQTVAYHWVEYDRISPNMAVAVVAAEDQKFPRHWGFDFDAISNAIEENRSRKTPRGASTISQQVAKNLFLWSGRSWLRKGLEAYQTLWIELLWPKQRILEVYLNIAEFGPGIYGVSAASREYFQKPASELTGRESALLTAVLPNPHQLKVRQPTPYVRRRTEQIRQQVARLGGVDYILPLGG